ncbi:MAG: D-2-hydroxyacid dehydrogenase [Hyphomicrobiales bacterium]|nr:D-2-hydroxyacid dehydrogenase [Hyphomicrobiales bacterium]MDE2373367.1 D-2-hydroxyacid dehydrogenase [Hyphomicrobiales bacterium]
MTKVLVLDVHAEIYRDRLKSEFPASAYVLAHRAEDLPRDLSGVDVLISFAIGLRDEFYQRATGLKWIQCLATGVDHVLRCPSLQSTTLLTSGRGVHGAPMRETVLYLMLAVNRDVRQLADEQKAHIWNRRFYNLLLGKTAVVVGVGVVGTAIGQLLKAFGMQVIGVSRTPRTIGGFDAILPTGQLAEAAQRADFLINVLPSNADNDGLFDRTLFAAMKASAYYISAGRGQTVDEAALVTALRERWIAGAGLDVFHTEPLPPDSPFWELPNVFITPHLGGYTIEYEALIMPLIIDNMRAFLAGRQSEMRNIVTH